MALARERTIPIERRQLHMLQHSDNIFSEKIILYRTNYKKAKICYPLLFYYKLAEMPGVARVDHRTKCVSLVAISLSQNFETRNL
jgi:hypothetical protein